MAGSSKGVRVAKRPPLSKPRSLGVLMAVLALTGLLVRLAALAYWGTGTIESEGAEYAKIAENLRNGLGYIGLVSPGPEVSFSPLFPLLIAGTSFFTLDYEWAGRLVTLVMGALLPLPVFGLTSRLFNPRVGLIAAVLTMLHPLLLYLSFTVYSEGPYATLLLFAMYLVIRAINDSWIRLWMLVGGAFALCYLLRAEGFAAFAIALLFALTATEGNLSIKCKRAAYAIMMFLLLALPQVIFLYNSTGKVLLEGKSTLLSYYTGMRILAAERKPGMAYVSAGGQTDVPSSAPNIPGGYPERWEEKWAIYGIDSNLKGTGTFMRPFAEVVRETNVNFKDMPSLLAAGVRQNVPNSAYAFRSGWLGAPLLPALALLGVFRRPWLGPQTPARLFVIVITAASILATFFVRWGDARYYFIFVPLLSIWAANGIFEVSRWMKATNSAAGWGALAHPIISQCITQGLLVVGMTISPVEQVKNLYIFSDSAPPNSIDKELGLWIGGRQHGPLRIMDLSVPLSYHAGAQLHVFFPYTTSELACRYLDAAQVDYVILRRGKKFTKYYEDWLAQGIPDRRAELLPLPPVTGADKFVIYQWHRDDRTDVSHSPSCTRKPRPESDHPEVLVTPTM